MDVWENEGGAVPEDDLNTLTDAEKELLKEWEDGTLELEPEAPVPGADWEPPLPGEKQP